MSNELVTLEQQLKPMLPALQQALADRMPAERLLRTILVSCERQPRLLECSRQSMFSSAMTAAFLGLEVDGVTGQAYLVPFKDKKLGQIAQLLIGYQGYNTLAARSGYTVTADVVRELDEFHFEKGTAPVLRHVPSFKNSGARIIAAWACATSRSLPAVVEVLSIADVEAIKARSKAAGSEGGFSPWDDPKIGFPAMASKSARRRLRRSLPLNIGTRDYHMAARLDEAFEEQGRPSAIRSDGTLVIDHVETPLHDREPVPTPAAQDLVGHKEDAQIRHWKQELMEAAEGGTEVLLGAWKRVPKFLQPSLANFKDQTAKPAAERADKENT